MNPTPSPQPHLFLIAGEQSGDLHGSHLMSGLPNYRFSGVGGPHMRKLGLTTVLPSEQLAVMGFIDVIKNFPRLRRCFHRVRQEILQTQPEGVVFIDYPGFNLRMAAALRKKGYKGKLIQLIAPTVWAWKKGRIVPMARDLDLLLTIFPFEPDCFAHTPLKTLYIGHPLQERISNYSYREDWKEKLGIPEQAKILGIFPGSRTSEITSNLPKQLRAALDIAQSDPSTLICISEAAAEQRPLIQKIIAQMCPTQRTPLIPPQYTYELMRSCHAAIATSGTVTLELALHNVPTVVTYEIGHLNYLIAKYVVRLKLPFYCIVNILGNKEIFPEVYQAKLSSTLIAKRLHLLFHDAKTRQRCQGELKRVRDLLGQQQASVEAARAIEEVMA